MEQWYNSGRVDGAQVVVSYLKSTATTTITSLLQNAGSWTTIPALQVNAPSTATVVANRDGNAASNRRVSKTTVTGLNLAPGAEVMVRWAYALNNTTNGNGLSVDNVVITPQTRIFYSSPTATDDLTNLAKWSTSTDGTGLAPTSFVADNQVFYVQSTSGTVAAAIDRIGITTGATIWTVGGANSKIVVGTPTVAAALRVAPTKNIVGTIDVGVGSYFYHNHPVNPTFTLGTLATTSTVEYNSDAQPQLIPANQYGNLKISGINPLPLLPETNRKELGGPIVVAGTIGISNDSKLVLGNYDLTILSGGGIAPFSGLAYVVTNGSGRLRVRVPRGSGTTFGTKMTFPVGSSYTSYTPVTLQQTSTSSDDVFEVRVVEGVFKNYEPLTYAGTTSIGTETVNKTWLISKEVPVNPAVVNMTLQWGLGDAIADFISPRAHINHYTGGAWDLKTDEWGTGLSTGPFVAARTGISSFSPFAVSSRQGGALPVTLLSFGARRAGSTVVCTWSTASEKDNATFTIERSRDGRQFAAIGHVAGAGSTTIQQTYSFEDQTPLPSSTYYRLRQTDTDGTSHYSPVVLVKSALTARPATISPNPGPGRFEVWVPNPEITTLTVSTLTGSLVLTPVTRGVDNRLQFDLSNQAAGVYLVRVQTPGGNQVIRVVKN